MRVRARPDQSSEQIRNRKKGSQERTMQRMQKSEAGRGQEVTSPGAPGGEQTKGTWPPRELQVEL